jgi:hypothetical protein
MIDDASKEIPGDPQGAARLSWRRPSVAILQAMDAETGVNSTTDSTATFS